MPEIVINKLTTETIRAPEKTVTGLASNVMAEVALLVSEVEKLQIVKLEPSVERAAKLLSSEDRNRQRCRIEAESRQISEPVRQIDWLATSNSLRGLMVARIADKCADIRGSAGLTSSGICKGPGNTTPPSNPG